MTKAFKTHDSILKLNYSDKITDGIMLKLYGYVLGDVVKAEEIYKKHLNDSQILNAMTYTYLANGSYYKFYSLVNKLEDTDRIIALIKYYNLKVI